MQLSTATEKKVHLVSLGCARNRVDAEVMLGTLLKQDWAVTDEPENADAVIINTCGFIGPAKEESVDAILSTAELKKNNPDMKIIVTGCLTQRYKGQLAQGLPEVDLFIGTDEFSRIGDFLQQDLPKGTVKARRTHYLYSGELPKKNTLSKSSAYIKVAEGCQHNCSFCIIPAIRGKLRSRPIESVVAEARQLAREGVKEINLIAQDLAAYGRDVGNTDLLSLLKELVKVDDIQWIRLLYVYPENISEEFLEFFASQPKIVKYLDIPVQHASDRLLEKMNRCVTQNDLRQTILKLRRAVPEVAIRTSVMVGFPGETDEDFDALLNFVKEMKFTHLGCFQYSQEEGTVAGRMKDQIDEETKAYRHAAIMEAQQIVSRENMAAYIGKTMPILVQGLSSETDLLGEGRLSYQAPEVDGVVYINDGEFVPGSIQMVTITESHDYDLVGHIAEM